MGILFQFSSIFLFWFSHCRVNFKKNEKAYNSEGSEVLKALKESENDPREPGKWNALYVSDLNKYRWYGIRMHSMFNFFSKKKYQFTHHSHQFASAVYPIDLILFQVYSQ